MNNYEQNRTRSQENQVNCKNKNQVDDEEFVRIIPIPSSSHIIINNAVMIAGFPSPGMIGSIVAEQLIEQIGMHQIAYVHSKHILPGVLWAGGKLRHPFRIYGNEDGSICLLTCDVPITSAGIGSISANIIRWCCEHNVNKVLVVSGIFPGSIVPFPQDFPKRTSFLVENNAKVRNDIDDDGGKVNGLQTPNFAFIGGVPGQLLANCVIQFIHCMAVLVPTLSSSPDPEGAALAIETLNKLISIPKLSSLQLRRDAEMIKAQMSELAKLQFSLLNKGDKEVSMHDETEQIYK